MLVFRIYVYCVSTNNEKPAKARHTFYIPSMTPLPPGPTGEFTPLPPTGWVHSPTSRWSYRVGSLPYLLQGGFTPQPLDGPTGWVHSPTSRWSYRMGSLPTLQLVLQGGFTPHPPAGPTGWVPTLWVRENGWGRMAPPDDTSEIDLLPIPNSSEWLLRL